MTERKKGISKAFRPIENSVFAAMSNGQGATCETKAHEAALKTSSRSEFGAEKAGLRKEKAPKAATAVEGVQGLAAALAPLDKFATPAQLESVEKAPSVAQTGSEPVRAERMSKRVGTKQVEQNPVSAPGNPGQIPGALGGTASASAAVVKGGTEADATPKASASQAPRKLAAPKAAPASAKSDRDEQNGEQKAMKTNTNRHGFKLNEFVVYPAHGVGQVVSIEEQEVAGFKLELFVINFVKDKMTLRVPTSKVAAVGMRKLSDADAARRSLEILTGRARVKRTMWSRRAQEYEAKINSGDINAIAEVVRDLFRSDAQPEQSYSERQLYEAALDRMMREIAAVHRLTETEALKMIDGQLKKNAKRAPKLETAGAEAEADDADIEEAA